VKGQRKNEKGGKRKVQGARGKKKDEGSRRVREVKGHRRAGFGLCLLIGVLLGVLCACASSSDEWTSREGVALAREHPVIRIPLEGDITRRSAEISGLAWYGMDLVLLPQFPSRFSFSDDGALFVLSREDILAYLAGDRDRPLKPRKVPLVAPGLRNRIAGFEGYEAIAFHEDRVFLTVEAGLGREMMGYLVSGKVADQGKAIVLDPESLVPIPPKANLENLSDEALVVSGERVLTLYEANGLDVNPDPRAHVYSIEDGSLSTIPFPSLEYRITDATSADGMGRFWVANSFFWGDRGLLRPRPDPLRSLYGAGPTHALYHSVERLVEYRDYGSRVERTSRPPIQLELVDDLHPRNWEGVVRLAPHGFLLAADTYPETMLAFVPEEP
jgi:hypothetical protein